MAHVQSVCPTLGESPFRSSPLVARLVPRQITARVNRNRRPQNPTRGVPIDSPGGWLGACLLLSALTWGVGTWFSPGVPSGNSTAKSGTIAIEQVTVGRRALVNTPHAEQDLAFGEDVDPATWRHLKLVANKKTGGTCDIELLRPLWWLEFHDVRAGGINDGVDTVQEGWEDRSIISAWHHERSNRDTSRRIKRSQQNRFEKDGGCLPGLIYGYRRRPEAKGDQDVEKIPEAQAIYDEWLDRHDRGQGYSQVADWLNASGVAGRSSHGKTEREVATELGITTTAAQRAVSLQRLMDKLGIQDPYQPVTKAPSEAKLRRHLHSRYRFEALPDYEPDWP